MKGNIMFLSFFRTQLPKFSLDKTFTAAATHPCATRPVPPYNGRGAGFRNINKFSLSASRQ